MPLKVTSLSSPFLLEKMATALIFQQQFPAYNLPWETKQPAAPLKKGQKPEAEVVFPEFFMTPDEISQVHDLKARLFDICNAAARADIALLIDAEQSFRYIFYFQMHQ